MHSLSARVKFLIESSNLSVTAAAKKCGIPQPRLNDIVLGRTLNPRSQTVAKIAAGLNSIEGWILTGRGPIRDGNKGHSTPMIEETAAAYRKGLELDGEPLTQREINELKMLRWLEEKHPERRQRISDQLTEVFIAAKAKG